MDLRPRVDRADLVLRLREHPAGTAGAVEDGADDARLGECFGVAGSRRLTISRTTSRGVKCSPAVSLLLGELADQLLEEVAHLEVRDAVWVQVDLADPRDHW